MADYVVYVAGRDRVRGRGHASAPLWYPTSSPRIWTASWPKPHRSAVNQVELHPYFVNGAVRAAAERHGIAIEAHSPLGHNSAPLSPLTITGIAASYGKLAAQIILRWHIDPKKKNAWPHRYPEVIMNRADARNIHVFDFELTAQEVAAIDALDPAPDGRNGPNPDNYVGVLPRARRVG